METSFNETVTQAAFARLKAANRTFATLRPGDSSERQPVHTVYGGAQLYKAETTSRLGQAAIRMMNEYAPDAAIFARALGLDNSAALADTIHHRVAEKLAREAVEDYRIDFEDGYGNRSDAEEDGHAEAAALEVARGMKTDALPPYIGIRIKPFTDELLARSARTLDIFVTTLLGKTGGSLPDNFVVTLPKITVVEQVETLADLLAALESAHGLRSGSIPIELMVETPQSVIAPDGEFALPRLVAGARGRCRGAHFGTYDYTAGVNLVASQQRPAHPACDFARHVMQVSLAGTGVTLSDGATTVMPVGPHKAPEGGSLSWPQHEENTQAIHHAWRVHFEDVRSSLLHGYYQGWDLHPGQLPSRYAAVFSFFLEGHEAASERLKTFVEKAAQATLLGNVFDDAATGQGLLNFFLRGITCGALTEEEALQTGLSLEELRGRSFVKILKTRQG